MIVITAAQEGLSARVKTRREVAQSMKATAGYGGAEQAADLVSGEHVAGPRSVSRGAPFCRRP